MMDGTKKKEELMEALPDDKGPLDHPFFSAPDIERFNDL